MAAGGPQMLATSSVREVQPAGLHSASRALTLPLNPLKPLTVLLCRYLARIAALC